ncbi:MAG: NINE protein [Planctomycetota bacterium]
MQEPKTTLVAFLFCVLGFVGVAGLHRFYLGRWGTGLLWLVTGGLFAIGTVIDLILIPGLVERKNDELALADRLL